MDPDIVAAGPPVVTPKPQQKAIPFEVEMECFAFQLGEAIVAEIAHISDLETAEDRRILREAVMATVRDQIAALKSRNE